MLMLEYFQKGYIAKGLLSLLEMCINPGNAAGTEKWNLVKGGQSCYYIPARLQVKWVIGSSVLSLPLEEKLHCCW